MAMQLRSGRRLASPVPAPAPRGDLRRARPRRIQDGGDDDDSKDRLSSLPKDMRLEVLARLQFTREAMRASILSEPWRRLWTELRDLIFDDVTNLDSLLGTLAQVQPKLNRLCIESRMVLGGARISTLLDAADKLEPLELVVRLSRRRRSAPLVLPCFARATSLDLRVERLWFRLPPAGTFAALEELTLLGSSFLDPGVLLPRCPRLRKLRMNGICPRGVKVLAVESSSLQELVWHLVDIRQPVDVRVAAPNLKRFEFSSFSRKFTMALHAPKLEELELEWYAEDFAVGCAENDRWRLSALKLKMGQGAIGDGWQHVLSIYVDSVAMVVPPVERSFQQEVARLGTLARCSALELHFRSEGHVIGGLVLQLLQIRTTLRRLKIVLHGVDDRCWDNCGCDVASSWRDELISLPRLEVAELEGFRGHDHEVDLIKLLFESAPNIKRIAIQYSREDSLVVGAWYNLHNMFSAYESVTLSFSWT